MPYNNAVRALYTYQATDPDELSFEEDDILFIIKDGDDEGEWLNAVNLKDVNVEGLVPANYVETVRMIALICVH